MEISWQGMECKDAAGANVSDLSLTRVLDCEVRDPVRFMEAWENGGTDVPDATLSTAWCDILKNPLQTLVEDCAYADLPKQLTVVSLSQSLAGWMESDFCSSIRAGISLPAASVNQVQFHSQSQIEAEQREVARQRTLAESTHQEELAKIAHQEALQKARREAELAELEKNRELSQAQKDLEIQRMKRLQEDEERVRQQQIEESEQRHNNEILRLQVEAAELKRRLEEAKRPILPVAPIVEDELLQGATSEYQQAWKSRWTRLSAPHHRNALEQFLGNMRNSATDFDLKLSHEQGVRSRSVENGDVCSERILRHGDSLGFDFTPPMNGWLTVLDLGSSGAATVLLPNFLVKSNDPKLMVCNGQSRHFLSDFIQMDDRQMTVQSEERSYGFEGICVLITPEPLITELCEDGLTTYRWDGMVGKLDFIRKKLSQLDKRQWSVGLLEFVTRPQNEVHIL